MQIILFSQLLLCTSQVNHILPFVRTGVLPNNRHHHGSNNNDSQIRQPVITKTTSRQQQQQQQRAPPQHRKKQVTYSSSGLYQQQPRLARGLPSRSVTMKSKGDACRECPNKVGGFTSGFVRSSLGGGEQQPAKQLLLRHSF